MERNELVAWLDQSAELLPEHEIDWLLDAANRLEVARPEQHEIKNRGHFLLAITNALVTAYQKASMHTDSELVERNIQAGRDSANALLAVAETNRDAVLRVDRSEKPQGHLKSRPLPSPVRLEAMAREAGEMLHAAIAAVQQHAIDDHHTIAWWECYDARIQVAAAASALVSAIMTESLKDL